MEDGAGGGEDPAGQDPAGKDPTSPATQPTQSTHPAISSLAVELVLLLYLFSITFSDVPIRQFEFDTGCLVDSGNLPEICEALRTRNTTAPELQDAYYRIETLYTRLEVWLGVVRSLVPALLLPFMGPWSDRRGRRKALMLAPVAAEAVSYGLLAGAQWLKLGRLGLGAVRALPGLTGGGHALLLAVFSHVGENSPPEERTARLGRLTLLVLASQPLSYIGTALFFVPGNYYSAILPSLFIFILAFLIGLIFIKDKNPKPVPNNFIKDFFDPKDAFALFRVNFKKREGNKRQILILLLIANMMTVGYGTGEGKVAYQYIVNVFKMTETVLSQYFAFSAVMLTVGSFIAVNIFVKCWKMKDHNLGLLSTISKFLCNGAYALVKEVYQLFIVTSLDIFSACTTVATRSMASKVVPAEELGTLFSLFEFADLIFPHILSIAYGELYTATSQVFPGAFFFFSWIFMIITIGIFCYIGESLDESSENVQASTDGKPQLGQKNEAFVIEEQDLDTKL